MVRNYRVNRLLIIGLGEKKPIVGLMRKVLAEKVIIASNHTIYRTGRDRTSSVAKKSFIGLSDTLVINFRRAELSQIY